MYAQDSGRVTSRHPEAPISDSQRRFIRNLLERKTGDLVNLLKAEPAIIDRYNLSDASKVIDRLMGYPDDRSKEQDMNRAVPEVPSGRYALNGADGIMRFYQVEHGKAGGRWASYLFVSQITGAPGGFHHNPLRGFDARKAVLEQIAAEPDEALRRFGRELGICGCCGSPLTNAESRAAGIGPVCATKG